MTLAQARVQRSCLISARAKACQMMGTQDVHRITRILRDVTTIVMRLEAARVH